ncbi:Calx-beta domain-containing protein [Micromonosporaceae bacterium B7E4]
MARIALGLLAAGLVATPVTAARAADPGVEPSTVTLTLGPGQSAQVDKVVHTPTIPPNPDVVLLADTTTSMGPVISAVQNNLASIIGGVQGPQPSARFAVAQYKDEDDEPDIPAFSVLQNLTADPGAVQNAVQALTPLSGGGSDAPEDWINALYQVANGAIAFRPESSRVVVLVGDSSSHDPSKGRTLSDAIGALQTADIRVVAVDVGPTPDTISDGLNSADQASAVVDATDGTLLAGTASNVVEQILAGIEDVQVTVTPTVTSCAGALSVTLAPASRTVDSGTDAAFAETVTVAPGTAAGTYQCSVDFLVDGVSLGFVQQLTVVVPGLAINDVQVDEGAGTATFTVSLSPQSTGPVTVAYATANGTATTADYGGTSGTLTFSPGQTSRQVTVPIVDDAVDEPTETFTVNLSQPVGAAITDPTGVGTIVDNDRDGVFSCTATALRVDTLTAARANPADVPCVDDAQTVAQAELGAGIVSVRTSVLNASTDQAPDDLNSAPKPGDGATAAASVDSTRITAGLVTVELGAIHSTAAVSCAGSPAGLTPGFTGSSAVTSLRINGVPVTVGSAPLTVPLVIGSLKLNETVTTGTSVTQRAVVLDTPLVDVVIGEAKANVEGTTAHPSGHPCQV